MKIINKTTLELTPVFPGNATGFLLNFKKAKNFANCIVYIDSLTPEIIKVLVENRVKAIITKSFFYSSHAANMLRAYCLINHNIPVFTNACWEDICEMEYRVVYLNKQGILSLRKDNFQKEIREQNTMLTYSPREIDSLFEINLKSNQMQYIYWPKSKFSKFAFSLLKEEFENDLKDFFKVNATCSIRDDGIIFFKNSLPLSLINSRAKSLHKSYSYYCDMIINYEKIYNCLKQSDGFECLCYAIKLYYRKFILLHRSYESIFVDCFNMLTKKISLPNAHNMMNSLLFSKIDLWLTELPFSINSKKTFLQDEVIMPLPNFTLQDDIKESEERVEQKAQKYNLSKDFIEELKKYSNIFVVKEWKFVLYKVIFSRLNKLILDLNVDKKQSIEVLGNLTYKEMRDWIYG